MALVDTIGECKRQWLAEGEAAGQVKGKLEATATALISLLIRRFGEVAPLWQEQVRGADQGTLERWFDRAIDAPDLPSVFTPTR